MKFLILTSGLIIASSGLAQKNASIESLGDDILYRGYENKVTVKVHKDRDGEIKLIGENVTVKQGEKLNEYIVKTGNDGPIATLQVVSLNGVNIDTLTSVNYRIYNLPDPHIYWGKTKSGETANIQATELSIRYPDGVLLPNEHTIIKWETSFEGKTVSGEGNNLESAEKFMKSIPDGTTLIFSVTVLGPDGITRYRKASWTVHSWEEEREMNPLGFDR